MKTTHLTLSALACTLLLALQPSAVAQTSSISAVDHQQPRECSLPASPDTSLESALEFCSGQAVLGYAQAQYNLGNYWYEGVLTEPDFARALHWYEQASVQGHAGAQFRLGQMHAAGEGVPVNRAQAYVILKMSAINGSDDAYDAADALETEMSSLEQEQANQVLSRLFRRYLRHIQAQGTDLLP